MLIQHRRLTCYAFWCKTCSTLMCSCRHLRVNAEDRRARINRQRRFCIGIKSWAVMRQRARHLSVRQAKAVSHATLPIDTARSQLRRAGWAIHLWQPSPLFAPLRRLKVPAPSLQVILCHLTIDGRTVPTQAGRNLHHWHRRFPGAGKDRHSSKPRWLGSVRCHAHPMLKISKLSKPLQVCAQMKAKQA